MSSPRARGEPPETEPEGAAAGDGMGEPAGGVLAGALRLAGRGGEGGGGPLRSGGGASWRPGRRGRRRARAQRLARPRSHVLPAAGCRTPTPPIPPTQAPRVRVPGAAHADPHAAPSVRARPSVPFLLIVRPSPNAPRGPPPLDGWAAGLGWAPDRSLDFPPPSITTTTLGVCQGGLFRKDFAAGLVGGGVDPGALVMMAWPVGPLLSAAAAAGPLDLRGKGWPFFPSPPPRTGWPCWAGEESVARLTCHAARFFGPQSSPGSIRCGPPWTSPRPKGGPRLAQLEIWQPLRLPLSGLKEGGGLDRLNGGLGPTW